MKRLIYLTFLLIFSALTFSACSAPAASTTENQAQTSNSTEVAVIPTDTDRPPATPTLSPRLEVVESFPWIDQLGLYRVDVLAHNPFDYPVYVTLGQAILHESSGESLVVTDFYLGDGSVMGGLGIILPGDTIPASACFTCLGTNAGILPGLGDTWADTLTTVFKVTPTDPIAYSTEFEVEAGTFINEAYDSYALNGTVTYRGVEPLGSAFVRVIVYDRDGNYIGWGEADVFGEFYYDEEGFGDFKSIETGTTLPFSALVSFPKSEGPLEYDITVIGVVAQQ
jgi:hypothetical protein